mmetsp:Transcript_6560/g.9613  ORF Transcript_6560/g.9613 Transcript_6560/m.9613 type:complete len:330 (+) Transcript_6560:141-1130(+)
MKPLKKLSIKNGIGFVIIVGIFLVVAPIFLLKSSPPHPSLRQKQQQQSVFPNEKNLPLEDQYKSDHVFQISRLHKLLYVHIPKTGGTTIEVSSLFDDARAHHAVGGHHPISKMLENANERGIDVENFFKVAHVRHPCERFISAFNYLAKGGASEGDAQQAQVHGIDRLSIDEFVTHITNREWFKKGAPIHFIPQVDYLFYKTDGVFGGRSYSRDRPDGTFGVDMVLCQDHWEEGLERLSRRMYHMILPQTMYNRQNYAEKRITCRDLQKETREMIEGIYAMDYCVFGYHSFLSDSDMCVGSFMTPEQFTMKYEKCKEEIKNDAMLNPWL